MPVTLDPEDRLVATVQVKIDGTALSSEKLDSCIECVVEQSLKLPALCSLRFHDANLVPTGSPSSPLVDDTVFSVGKTLEISIGYEQTSNNVLFKGEITGLDADLAAHGYPTFVVRAMTKMHRLNRGRKRRSFINIKDSDVVQQVCSGLGLTLDVDATDTVHPYIFQNNQTDFEFLTMLANRNGYHFYATHEGEVKFKRLEDPSGSGLKIKWGEGLRSFRPRLSGSSQVSKVQVRGWDPKDKAAIIGSATEVTGAPETGLSSETSISNELGSSVEMMLTDHIVDSPSDATRLAQSVLDQIGGACVEADGLCEGDPRLFAGQDIEIEGAGNRFSGKYLVSSATHTWSSAEGYTTTFAVAGKNLETLDGMINPDLRPRGSIFNNVMVGIVTNNQDEDGNDPMQHVGRVKVKFPAISDQDESYWARIASPMAGNERGFMFLPEVDDEVLVAFENGDIHRPYIIGQLWNGQDAPPVPHSEAVKGGSVEKRTIKTRVGHMLQFNDESGSKQILTKTEYGHEILMDDQNKCITIKTPNGHKVHLDDQGKKIEIIDMNGSNKMVIDSNSNNISSECQGNYSIKALGNIDIECQGNFTAKSTGNMSLEATGTWTGKAMAALTAEGMASATFKSSGIVTIQGSLVKIN
ncbi:MAG TPA: VgrG-related protein [Fimbriimonadaceae bacterium]|nr:VgrG-related protein [Fimbriimonadaceae bacterium]